MESVDLRELSGADGDRVRTFWLACGIRSRPGDDDASLDAFARKNPGLALLAEDRGRIIGTALAGWDGRRAWLYHVAVHPGTGGTATVRVVASSPPSHPAKIAARKPRMAPKVSASPIAGRPAGSVMRRSPR